MRRATVLAPAALLLLVACQRPEVEAFRQHPRSVVVACTVTPEGPGSKDFAATLEAALRVRLASRVTVVPEGVTPPPDAVRLEVDLKRKGVVSHSGNAAAVGVGVGASVGVLSAAAGDRDWFFDGLFWGLFAGSNAAAGEDRYSWLGYYPDDISSDVRLMQPGDPEPLAVESIDTSDLLQTLEPLRGDEGTDETRVEEAEAQAFARVVVSRLADRFQWRRGAPSYYGAPVVAPEAPAPAPQSIDPKPEEPVPEPAKS
ncbi:MAG TPA: hypothetical protein VNV60_00530 [Holophagaceae bacterium]|jgi:hypothetical protein|nr:hypothetical protein [Holophagaceae bacterium]